MNITFSIIVPIYNVKEEYLHKILKNIRCQTYKNYEVIFINDCSTDIETIKFLKITNFNKNELIIHNKKNIGLGMTRNIGILNSKNDYLIFIDPDDEIPNNFLYIIKQNIINTNKKFDIYHFNYMIYDGETIKENKKEIKLSNSVNIYGGMSWLNAYKKSFIIKNKLFFLEDRIIHEDEYFIMKILEKTELIFVIKKFLYIYNKSNANSITSLSSSTNSLLNLSIIAKEIINFNFNELLFNYSLRFLYFPIHYISLKDNDVKFNFFLKVTRSFNEITKKLKKEKLINNSDISLIRKIYIFLRYKIPFVFLLYLFLKR